ncbi:hypothetical protein J6E39_08820 [bacterium]|nr:hypothetical protein [bacterium]
MKKVLLVLGLLAFMNIPALGSDCAADLCAEPYDLSNGVSRFFSTVSGSNFASQKVAQTIVKKEIKKNSETSDLKVKVKSFSGKDLKEGRFKSMSVSGKDVSIGDVYISELNAHTICDFNYIAPNPKNSKEVIFKENFPVDFTAKFSQDDINKMISSKDYQKVVADLNAIGKDSGLFRISSTYVRIKNNRFLYVIKFSIPFVKKYQEVVISSDLKVKNGEIAFTDTKILNSNFNMDVSKMAKILNYINPLDYSLDIIDNKDTKLNIQNVSIENDMVVLKGRVTVLKDTIR